LPILSQLLRAGLLPGLFVVSAAEEAAEELTDTGNDFADSFPGFNDAILNGFGKAGSHEGDRKTLGQCQR